MRAITEKPGGGEANTEQLIHNKKYTTDPENYQSLIDTLGGHQLSDGSYMALCPAHADKNPSLHITPGDNGKLLVNCQAGCSQDAVIQALKNHSLWPEGSGRKSSTANLPLGIPYKWYGDMYAAHWNYHDDQGIVIGHVVRYEGPDGKQMVPFFKQNGTKWKAGATPEPRPLYNLHLLSRNPDKPVLIVEGEKAADAAGRHVPGYVCMTWPGGSNAVRKADFGPLRARVVAIWPDADGPGRKAAEAVKQKCKQAGAQSVTILKPPENVKTGWDLADAEAEGWTRQQIQEIIEAARERSAGFRFIPVANLKTKSPQWLIKGLMEKDSLVQIFGDPGCGKSFIGIDIACCVAAGRGFHGHQVEPGGALYIAGEGINGIGRRFTAWKIRHRTDFSLLPLFLSTAPASFCDEESMTEVQKAIEATAINPALIVIDTLARNFGPGDENSTQDMSRFIAALDEIRTRHRCTILLIHHSGHADKTRSRGAIALRGALDVEYRMVKNEHGIVQLEHAKPPKDFEPPEPLAFEIRTVELGIQDEDGEHVTSAILDRVDYDPAPQSGSNAGRGKWQITATRLLRELIEQHRGNLEAGGYNPDQARVKIIDWQEKCYEAGMDRRQFHKIKKSLESIGSIKIENEYVAIQ